MDDEVPQMLERGLLKRLTLTRSYSRMGSAPTGRLTDECLSIRVGVHSIQGCRKEMEDTHCNVLPTKGELLPTPTTPGGTVLSEKDLREAGEVPEIRGFFGVFDGHGGCRAAEYVEAQLFDAFVRQYHAKYEYQNSEEPSCTDNQMDIRTETTLLDALLKIFKRSDVNADDMVEPIFLKKLLSRLLPSLTDEQCQMLISVKRANHAGRIRIDKWLQWIVGEEAGEEAKSILRKAFHETEAGLIQAQHSQEWDDGTTAAVVAILQSADGELSLLAGNVGDSEVLLGRHGQGGTPQFLVLSEIHNMKKNSDEKTRVEAVGGRVWRGRLGHPKLNPQIFSLAVSRAMGDSFFKHPDHTGGRESGLSAEPFVQHQCLNRHDRFLVLGCDGFFDVVEYQEAVDFVFARLEKDGGDPQGISEALVELAQDKGSTDNITVLLVLLDQ